MGANITPIVLTNTMQYVIDRVNDLIAIANTRALISNSSVVGNTSLEGTFTTTGFISNTANIANFNTTGIVSNTTNLTLTPNTINSSITNTNILVVGNTNMNSFSVNTTGTSVQVIDSFLLTTYGSAEYILDVKDNSANNQTHSRLSILNSGTIFSTEYGILTSNNSIGQFTTTSNSTHAILNYQPLTSANTTVKGFRTLITK